MTGGLSNVDFAIRLAASAGIGLVIGLERQWHRRPGGIHLTSLVCVGSAIFSMLDLTLASGDTTRIVAGLVTGVGFLAGGVILRGDSGVSGLNTAATIWATAAIGALCGFGLWWPSLASAVCIVALNMLLDGFRPEPRSERRAKSSAPHDERIEDELT